MKSLKQTITVFAIICLTINGAEIEALLGMKNTLKNERPSLLIVNQGYMRPTVDGVPFAIKVSSILEKDGFKTSTGKRWITANKPSIMKNN